MSAPPCSDSTTENLFNIWDFGGQEIFYPTHQFFLTKNSIYIITFNAEKFQRNRVEYWMWQIRTVTDIQSPPSIFLVGTHIDLIKKTEEELAYTEHDIRRQFPHQRFIGLRGVFFISAKTGSGIQELREQILLSVERKIVKIPKVLPPWIQILDIVEEKAIGSKEKQPYIKWTEFIDWSLTCGVKNNEEDIEECSKFLVECGRIVSLYEPEEIDKGLIILDPLWLATLMGNFLTFKHTWINKGILHESHMKQVFIDYPVEIHLFLVNMLKKFNILYPLKTNSSKEECSFIIPSMLPLLLSENDVLKFWVDPFAVTDYKSYGRNYLFSFMPHGLISRLIVRLLHLPAVVGLSFSKHAVILNYHGQIAMIEYFPSEYQLCILVRVPTIVHSDLFFRWIIDITDSLLEDAFHMSKAFRRTIPCIHCLKIAKETVTTSFKPFSFTFREVIEAITNKRISVFCNHIHSPSREVRINELAPDIAFANIRIFKHTELSISNKIGSGAFGSVFSGFYKSSTSSAQRSIKKPVAIKRLELNSASRGMEDLFRNFQQEVYIMSKLNHPNLVRLIGVTLYPEIQIILELLLKGNLFSFLHPNFELFYQEIYNFKNNSQTVNNNYNKKLCKKESTTTNNNNVINKDMIGDKKDILENDPIQSQDHNEMIMRRKNTKSMRFQIPMIDESKFPWSLRILIALDIAKGMHFLQSQSPPVIHRDLRSPNIFLASLSEKNSVRAKVADFGMSRFVASGVEGTLNTWEWVAPETLSNNTYNQSADVYSFGIICWEISSRSYPFDEYYNVNRFCHTDGSLNIIKIKEEIIKNKLRPSISLIDRSTPYEFRTLIESCWIENPSERPSFATIVQLLTELYEKKKNENAEDLYPEEKEEIIINNNNINKSFINPQKSSQSIRANSLYPTIRNTVQNLEKKTNWSNAFVKDYKITERIQLLFPATTLTLVNDTIWIGCRDGSILVVDKLLQSFNHRWKAHEHSITAILHDDDKVWTASVGGCVRIWNAKNFNELQEFHPFRGFSGESIKQFLLVPKLGGSFEVWGSSPNQYQIFIWDSFSFDLIHYLPLPKMISINSLHFCYLIIENNATGVILAGDLQGEIYIIEAETLQYFGSWKAHDGPISGIQSSQSNDFEIWTTCKNSPELKIWKMIDDEMILEKTSSIHSNGGYLMLQSNHSVHVIFSCFGKTIVSWDSQTGKAIQEMIGHSEPIVSIFARNNFIYSISKDGWVLLWEKLQKFNPSSNQNSRDQMYADILQQKHSKDEMILRNQSHPKLFLRSSSQKEINSRAFSTSQIDVDPLLLTKSGPSKDSLFESDMDDNSPIHSPQKKSPSIQKIPISSSVTSNNIRDNIPTSKLVSPSLSNRNYFGKPLPPYSVRSLIKASDVSTTTSPPPSQVQGSPSSNQFGQFRPRISCSLPKKVAERKMGKLSAPPQPLTKKLQRTSTAPTPSPPQKRRPAPVLNRTTDTKPARNEIIGLNRSPTS